jgi:hypothetical protein
VGIAETMKISSTATAESGVGVGNRIGIALGAEPDGAVAGFKHQTNVQKEAQVHRELQILGSLDTTLLVSQSGYSLQFRHKAVLVPHTFRNYPQPSQLASKHTCFSRNFSMADCLSSTILV